MFPILGVYEGLAMPALIMLIAVVWIALGLSGFLFWWTREYDFTTKDIGFAVLMSFLGPIGWLAGWDIHGKHNDEPKVIIRSKKGP